MAVLMSMCHVMGVTGCDCVDVHVSCSGCDCVLTSMCHVVDVTVS